MHLGFAAARFWFWAMAAFLGLGASVFRAVRETISHLAAVDPAKSLTVCESNGKTKTNWIN